MITVSLGGIVDMALIGITNAWLTRINDLTLRVRTVQAITYLIT